VLFNFVFVFPGFTGADADVTRVVVVVISRARTVSAGNQNQASSRFWTFDAHEPSSKRVEKATVNATVTPEIHNDEHPGRMMFYHPHYAAKEC
jgi:hypothetical protein